MRCPACGGPGVAPHHKVLAALRALVRCRRCGAGLRFGWGAQGTFALIELVACGAGAALAIRSGQPLILVGAVVVALLGSLPLPLEPDGRDGLTARRQRFPERYDRS